MKNLFLRIIYILGVLFLIPNVYAGEIADFDLPWWVGVLAFMMTNFFGFLIIYLLIFGIYCCYKNYLQKKYKKKNKKNSKYFIILTILKVIIIILFIPLVFSFIINCMEGFTW